MNTYLFPVWDAVVRDKVVLVDLCQFFTSDDCCDALISEIGASSPRYVVDVGAGYGSLARAAIRRWGGIDLRLLDVDRVAMARLKIVFPGAEQVRTNLLLPRMPDELAQWVDHADIALCNPPFKKVSLTTADYWLKRVDMPTDWSAHIRQRAETVFLAHNLRLLRADGELAMILPACFINGHHFLPFRRWLLQRMTVTKVARLPRRSFRDAEVNTFAIIARNSIPRGSYPVELIDFADGNLAYRSVTVSSSDGVSRLDIASQPLLSTQRVALPLKDFSPQISRGRPVSELREWGETFFHTTHFCHVSTQGNLCLLNAAINPHWHVAEPGDLLMGRVGRSCHAQIAKVLRGTSHFSDCVYRIRVPSHLRSAVFESLWSSEGLAWRAARTRGSTVALLSKSDLLEHPIWITKK